MAVYKPLPCGGLIRTQPYYVYKNWIVTDSNYRDDYYQISVLKGITPLLNQKINVSESVDNEVVRESDELDNSASNNKPLLSNMFQKNVWSSLNQTFYKHRAGNERILYTSASIFSVPVKRMGDGLKPNSITITDNSVTSSIVSALNLSDEKINEYHGNIIDNAISTSSYASYTNLIGYWGFNEELNNRNPYDDHIKDNSNYSHNAVGRCLKYIGGIETTGDAQLSSGKQISLNGSSSYVRVDHNTNFNFFKDNSYAISLWVTLPNYQFDVSSEYNWIVSKNGTFRDYGIDTSINPILRRRNVSTSIYPFEIKVHNRTSVDGSGNTNIGLVEIAVSDGLTTTSLLSTTRVNDTNQHHIVFNKNGSELELWVDGTKEASSSLSFGGQIQNEYDILFGSKFLSDADNDVIGGDFRALSASLDEVRIYNTNLTDTQIDLLSNNDYVTGSAYQTNVVGEVFYKHGIISISDPRPIYKNVLVGKNGNWDYGSDSGFQVKYKSSKQLNEVSLLCEIGANEFNVSQNPTLRKNDDINNTSLKGFATGSNFKPYVTTIGLYNDFGDLLAVGKLGSALKKRNDTDVTVKVRFDLDGVFGTPFVGQLEEQSPNITLTETSDGSFVWNKPIDVDWAATTENTITLPKSVQPKKSCPIVPSPTIIKSLRFDGVDEDILLGNNVEYRKQWTDAFSIETWFYATTSSRTKFQLSKWDGGLPRGYFNSVLGYNPASTLSGTARLQLRQAAAGYIDAYSSGSAVTFDALNHVVTTYNGGGTKDDIEFYINNTASTKPHFTSVLGSGPITSGTILNSEPLTIGSIPDLGAYTDSDLHIVRMWDVELSSNDVNNLYNNTLIPSSSNLIINLDINNSIFSDGEFTITDLSATTSSVRTRNMESGDQIFQSPFDT